jgi:hypothetical protein
MKNAQSLQTVVTLANACDLVSSIVQDVIGNDVSDAIEGNTLTRDATHALAMSQFQKSLNTYRGAI